MKKDNLAALGVVALLSTCNIALYVTKVESIILGVDIPSYFIFASMMIISSILLLNKEDIVAFMKIALSSEHEKTEIPNEIYNFCKHYYFESDEAVAEYLKSEVKNKRLANFLVRYIDKNTKEEIDDYIYAQEFVTTKLGNNARKVVYYSNFFMVISVIASYIYDSNIKGILLIAGTLCLSNLFVYKKVERNIAQNREELLLYKSISDDILNLKNAKHIMYKCMSILAIDDDFVTIDNLTVNENTEAEIKEKIVKKESVKNYDTNIEERPSALITIGKNKRANEKDLSRRKEMRM